MNKKKAPGVQADRICKQIVDGFLDDGMSDPFFKVYDGPCTEAAVVEMAKEAHCSCPPRPR